MPKRRRRLPSVRQSKREAREARKRLKDPFHESPQTLLNVEAYGGQLNARRWVIRADKLGKMGIHTFYAKFAAQAYLDALIDEADVSWDGDTRLTTSEDVEIQSNDLREIFRYRPKKRERNFELNEDHTRYAEYIRSDQPYVETEDRYTVRKRRSRKGMFLVKDIAQDLGISSREARGILRGLMKKPDKGWAWTTQAEADDIKKKLQEAIA